MNAEELKEKIAARQKEAQDKQISWQAQEVVYGLGILNEDKAYNYENTKGHFDSKNGLYITYHSFWEILGDGGGGGSSTEIIFEGQIVFREAGSIISCYIPGAWEILLKNCSVKAREVLELKSAAKKVQQEAADLQKIQEEAKKWGL